MTHAPAGGSAAGIPGGSSAAHTVDASGLRAGRERATPARDLEDRECAAPARDLEDRECAAAARDLEDRECAAAACDLEDRERAAPARDLEDRERAAPARDLEDRERAAPARDLEDDDMKEQALLRSLAAWPSLVVAYSGGVDSAYLAWAATRVLGRRALCITADSPSYSDRHRALARQIAADFGFAHEVIHTDEMSRPEYRANPANRCYYCKHELYTHLTGIARARGIPTIADGSNADDRGDYRPGRQAAREFGVVSPLDAVGLTKSEIRELSHRAGLPTWDEPASACLSSRIPYFSEVTDAKLRMIEQAEAVLRDHGFRVCRVRHHGDGDPMARIEIGRDEMARALEPDVTDAIDSALRALGYRHVTLDLRGYRLGSLNDALRLRPV